jgi:predicted esterase
MRYLCFLFFVFACHEAQPERFDTDTDDAVMETDSQNQNHTDETDDVDESIHNISPSEGTGGRWVPGEVGTTPLGASVRIPATYRPEVLASPVIWLFHEQLENWEHVDEDGAIVVAINEYNDWDAIYAKLNETLILLEEEYNVDRGRYYFAGWSAGGNIAVVVASMNQDIIAGTMVFPGTGGSMAEPYMAQKPAGNLRLFYACGDEDPNFPWPQVEQESNYWAAKYGYTTRFEKVEGAGHYIDEERFGIRAEAWSWLKNFNLKN